MPGDLASLVDVAERIEASLVSLVQTVTSEGFGSGGSGSGGSGGGGVTGGGAARSSATKEQSKFAQLASASGFTGVAPKALTGQVGAIEAAGQLVQQGVDLAAQISDPFSTQLERDRVSRELNFSQISPILGGQLNKIYENFTGITEQNAQEQGAKSSLNSLAQNLIYSGIDVTKESLVGPAKDILEREKKLVEARKASSAAIDDARKALGLEKPEEKKNELEKVLDGFTGSMTDLLNKLEDILRPF